MVLQRKLKLITIIYWILLVYIIAALVWWFIELEGQNREMTTYKISLLNADDPAYFQQLANINDERNRHFTQFLGEGLTFLFLIIIGAVYLYRAVRSQFKLQQQQENFMMAVTHELKTPIAITRLNLQTLQKHKLEEFRQEKLISASLQEVGRLDQLASNILVSAQLEGGRYHSSKEELDLSTLIREVIAHARLRFSERKWMEDVESSLHVYGDRVLIQMLINNLIENAYKYSPADSTIYTSLKKTVKGITLEVKDEGIGIPSHEKRLIFQKFYRVGNEQTRSAKGTGLGLYLCKKIADEHRTKIEVKDNHPAGSVFYVQFRPIN